MRTPGESVVKADAATLRRVADTLALAQQLNGVPMPFTGRDVVATIAGFAREYGITHIILGRSQRPWYRSWFGPSLIDRLVRAVPEATVIVAGTA